ncbi:hypothetical protein [Halorussus sp. AFM4]|uniref:hypothetical protein n=1 Tax=Halorussus sp. AFM4 TaxID=3421651 RepID=UPI003EBBABEF
MTADSERPAAADREAADVGPEGTGPAESRSESGRAASRRHLAVGAALGLAAAAGVASWRRSKHAPAGYVTWSRREETPAPDSLVYIWRRKNLGDIAPPF